MLDPIEVKRKRNLRNRAKAVDAEARFDRSRTPNSPNFGTVRLFDPRTNTVIFPRTTPHGATLDEVEDFLKTYRPARQPHAE